jgi:hypothetical protein
MGTPPGREGRTDGGQDSRGADESLIKYGGNDARVPAICTKKKGKNRISSRSFQA